MTKTDKMKKLREERKLAIEKQDMGRVAMLDRKMRILTKSKQA